MEQYILRLVIFYLQSVSIIFFIGLGFSHYLVSNKKNSLLTFLTAPVIGYYLLAIVLTGAGYLNINTRMSFIPAIIILLMPTLIYLYNLVKKTYKQLGPSSIFLKGIFVAIPIVLLSLIVLAPLLKYGAYAIYNDSYTYISIADYFRDHGFFQKANPNLVTWQTHVYLYQHIKARIGVSYVLSALMNLSTEKSSFWLLPAYQSLGLTVFLCAVSSFIYQLRKKILPVILIIFFTYTSFMYSVAPLMDGFIPQIFGVALFAFITTIIIQHKQKEISYFSYSVLLSTSFAALVNVYTELAPFVGLVLLTFFFLQSDYKSFKLPSFIKEGFKFFGPILISFIIFPIYYLFGVEYVKSVFSAAVGYNQPFGLNQMFLWLFGQEPFIASTKLKQLILLFSVLSAWCITIVGLKYALIKESKLTKKLFLSILLVFSAFIFFYRYFKLNAFQSGILGNSWSVWKLFGWSYIFILIFIVLGLDEAFKKTINKIFLFILLAAVFLGSFTIAKRMLVTTTLGMRQTTGIDLFPINEYRRIENDYSQKNNKNIFIISANRHPNHMLTTQLLLKNSKVDLSYYSKTGMIPGISEEYLKPEIKTNMEVWVDDAVPSVSSQEKNTHILTYNQYQKNSNIVLFSSGFSTLETLNEFPAIWLIEDEATLRLITKNSKKMLSMKISTPKGISGEISIVNSKGDIILRKTIDFDNPYNLQLSNPSIDEQYSITWNGPFSQIGPDRRTLRLLFSEIRWAEYP
jgi:hypothetical protein